MAEIPDAPARLRRKRPILPPVRWSCWGCETTWTASSYCHCAAAGCHRMFSGVNTFDMHRLRGKCADPASLQRKGKPLLRLDGEGIWRYAKEFTPAAIELRQQ